MTQNRWKSPVLWTAVVAQVVSILIMTNVIDLPLGDQVNQVAVAILQLLTLIGVLNNPENPEAM